MVASRVEAWIETSVPVGTLESQLVASRVEAWIETELSMSVDGQLKSPPAWRRGLKQYSILKQVINYVASRVEAWIETL